MGALQNAGSWASGVAQGATNDVAKWGITKSLMTFNDAAKQKLDQTTNLNKTLSTTYDDLLKQKPTGAPDITDPAVQQAYRAQLVSTQAQRGRSSTFMGGTGGTGSGFNFLGD